MLRVPPLFKKSPYEAAKVTRGCGVCQLVSCSWIFVLKDIENSVFYGMVAD